MAEERPTGVWIVSARTTADKEVLRVAPFRLEDVPLLVPVQLEAFAGYANARLGARYAAAALSFFAERPDAIALGCWLGERAVGFVCGVRCEDEVELGRAVRWTALRALLTRPWLLMERKILTKVLGRLRDLIVRPRVAASQPAPCWPGPVMGLVSIGVSEGVRGHGVGGSLLDAFEEVSRSRGFAGLMLSVYAENLAARRLYEGRGWWPLTDDSGANAPAVFYFKGLESR